MNNESFAQNIKILADRYNLTPELAIEITKKTLLNLLSEDFPNKKLSVDIGHSLLIFYEDSKGNKHTIDNTLISRHTLKKIEPYIMSALQNEANKDTYEKFKDHQGELFQGQVEFITDEKIVINIDGYRGTIPKNEQIPFESYKKNSYIWCFLKFINNKSKDILIFSRRGKTFIELLLKYFVPDINNGNIHIVAIARRDGKMTKVLVDSNLKNTIGSCLGTDQSHYKTLLEHLNGEKIRFIKYGKYLPQLLEQALGYNHLINNITIINNVAYVEAKESPHILIGQRGYNVHLAAKICPNLEKIHVVNSQEYSKIITEEENKKIEEYIDQFKEFHKDEAILKELQDFIHENNAVPSYYGLEEIKHSPKFKDAVKEFEIHLNQLEKQKYIEQCGNSELYDLFNDLPIEILWQLHGCQIYKIEDFQEYRSVQDLMNKCFLSQKIAFLIYNRIHGGDN